MSLMNVVYANSIRPVHVHGLSTIDIVIEKHNLMIELNAPALDLVGFEYQANTKENVSSVKRAQALLEQHKAVFELLGGNCQSTNKDINVSSVINIVDHSEIIARYDYICENLSALSSITVNVFQLFPRVETILSMWITETRQGATSLTSENSVIKFK